MLRICSQHRWIYFKSLIRPASTSNAESNNHERVHRNRELEQNFLPIYKLPLITKISLINRLKHYQSIATATAIPASLVLYQTSVLSAESLWIIISIGISGCASLFLIGSFANKFVGVVYLNKEEDSVRIAYIDFWGKRKDVDIPICDIVPLSETQTSITDPLYVKLGRFSVQEKLKFNLNQGHILDKKKFEKVFKPIPDKF